jgi:hypothetical protein
LRGASADGFEAVWRSNGHHPEIEDVVAASVETRAIRWLWNNRVPLGKLSLFDGDPGVGKSVVTLDLAARVSAGRPFPDGAPCEAGNVLICNVEDGIDDTVAPRLLAHGADMERVYIVNGVPDGKGGTRLLELPDDLTLLESKILQREATLMIVDPIMTLLSGDIYKDRESRRALTPVRDMAERTACAIVGVRNLNKSVGLRAIQRGGGNMGLIGVARAGAFFAEHPDDDALRVMAQHKSNLATTPPSLSYRVVSSEVHKTARVQWEGRTEHNADSLASGPASPAKRSKLDEAREFLRDELSDGPMWAKEIVQDAIDAAIAQATLYTAKAALRVRSEKIGVEGWQWSLPPEEDDDQPTPPDEQDVRDLPNLQGSCSDRSSNPPYISEDVEGLEGYEGGRSDDCAADLSDTSDHRGGKGHARTPRDNDAPVRALLADPPRWLADQLAKYREDPDRFASPTSAAVAAKVFGTAQRWREVMPVLAEVCG